MFYFRYPNRGNVVNCRNDQLLVAAGAKKRAFGWFNKMCITNSYNTALKKNDEMTKDFDKAVVEWKKAHENEYKAMKSVNLDPKNKEHVEQFGLTHPKPPDYQV